MWSRLRSTCYIVEDYGWMMERKDGWMDGLVVEEEPE